MKITLATSLSLAGVANALPLMMPGMSGSPFGGLGSGGGGFMSRLMGGGLGGGSPLSRLGGLTGGSGTGGSSSTGSTSTGGISTGGISTGGTSNGGSSGGTASGQCASYTIIDTRGTGEMQGPSISFRSMNQQILAAVPGGKQYHTVYLADFSQVSTMGTNDIVNTIQSTLGTNPSECFVLEGYSQGAAATTNALSQLSGASFDAVKAVFLVGNPMRQPGKACNVDTQGGQGTAQTSGMMAMLGGGIPDNWAAKTMDVCNFGDGVCDMSHGMGINMQHMAYGMDAGVQDMGAQFVKKQLCGGA